MAKKSIDGLVRRDLETEKTLKKQRRMAEIQRESVDLVSSKKPAKRPSTKRKVSHKKTPKTERSIREDSLIQEYLSEMQDTSPTELTEVETIENNRIKKETTTRKRQPKPKKDHSRRRKVILTVVAVVLLLSSILYMIADNFIRKTTADGNLWNFVVSSASKPLKTDKNGRTNILVFGTEGYKMDDSNHPGAQLTDSMLFISMNQKTGDVKTVSLPRDLYYKTCGANKLNEVYNCTYEKNNGTDSSKEEYEKKAAAKLEDAIEDITGVEIQYYVHLNWAALIDLVNAIGGIDVVFVYGDQKWDGDETTIETTSPKGLKDWDNTKKRWSLDMKNGVPYHLNGVQALQVARVRNAFGGYGASGGNFSREVFQQRIIQATVKKMKSTNYATNWGAIIKIKDAVGDNVRTNFEDSNLKTLMRLLGKVKISDAESVSILETDDGDKLLTSGMISGVSYVYPVAGRSDYSELHEYLDTRLIEEKCSKDESKNKDIKKCKTTKKTTTNKNS